MLEIIILLSIFILGLFWYIRHLLEELESIKFAKQSQSVKYGKISEHWAPFMKDYPYDPNNARFIGTPIDFLQFNDDKVVFVEVKTNKAKLNPREQNLKNLIENKNVEWYEFRIKE